MSTVRMGSGLAFTPQKDLDLFAAMAAEGKHLVGLTGLGHGWKFEDGEPEDAIFDLTYERHPDQDYLDIFAAAGWTPVVNEGGLQVFKAAPGTVPVHTGVDSRRAELVRNARRFGAWAALFVVTLALAAWLMPMTGLSVGWTNVVVVLIAIPTIYTLLPFFGFLWHLLRLPRHGSDRNA